MKLLFCVAFLAMMMSVGGCLETPVYSGSERIRVIERSQEFNVKSMNDDIDEALLLRPATHMTYWNVLHNF
ncbi:MAG: hypothetical protein ABR964_00800 [Tepidisphaeraceae bacterium]|jgi:hypothetical protein